MKVASNHSNAVNLPDQKFFAFLRRLAKNNRREWFNDHKSEFQRTVQEPAVELVRRLEKPLSKLAPFIEPIAKPNGGSVMRIYRDTRFAKDKTPYKTNVGISLKHAAGKKSGAPEFYIHLSPIESFVAGGCWQPDRIQLAEIRSFIDMHPKRWTKSISSKEFRNTFQLGGRCLKTSPRQYANDHPMIEDLRRIDFVGIAPLTIDEITHENFVEATISKFRQLRPLMVCLCEAIAVPF